MVDRAYSDGSDDPLGLNPIIIQKKRSSLKQSLRSRVLGDNVEIGGGGGGGQRNRGSSPSIASRGHQRRTMERARSLRCRERDRASPVPHHGREGKGGKREALVKDLVTASKSGEQMVKSRHTGCSLGGLEKVVSDFESVEATSRKGRVIETFPKTRGSSRSHSPRPRYRDEYRDRDYRRRSHSRSRGRYDRERYRGRERDYRRRSRSRSLSLDYHKGRVRERYDYEDKHRRNRSRSLRSASPARRSPSPRRSLSPWRTPPSRGESPVRHIRDERSPTPRSISPQVRPADSQSPSPRISDADDEVAVAVKIADIHLWPVVGDLLAEVRWCCNLGCGCSCDVVADVNILQPLQFFPVAEVGLHLMLLI
ncbi:hypothetical protein HHK36_008089 [Tetracentron sinense]|uniref:Uncharacterized protein n=1 Tax=Tetracentron sinense TaxID=13715 RepID=A0A835DN31_TETSI|nr:hypothetical protein HHK36_008089 [Tetracentron sinense]